ncbi:hypothetical protein [Methanococcus voltae]|uniref:Uncharacterized protein n=2 Tax=Methanococcus voltae TaxID=2188 RepID=A0A8J7RJB4_METVO|nr:hypothetical protein [Methanococcus voltae]MBP2173018.1 hypothetical protein [Methanococcus voltae]MBP2201926.1 hypothetical protein [Methanococcus voltae]MCS3922090.1 hypothetical protein [Methanococcus voltae PS]
MIKYSEYCDLMDKVNKELVNNDIEIKSQFNPKISDYLFELYVCAKPNFHKNVWNIELKLKTKQFNSLKLNDSKLDDINSKIGIIENILQKYDIILENIEYENSELNLIFKTK